MMDHRPQSISDSEWPRTIAERAHPPPLPRPRPPSSIYSDDLPAMLDLIRQVSDDLWEQEDQAVAHYTGEIRALEDELVLYRRAWNETITVANKVIRSITLIRKHVTKIAAAETEAGKDWMAFWGIYQKSVGSHPPFI